MLFDVEELGVEVLEFAEGGGGGDAEDEQEAFAGFHVEFSGDGEGLVSLLYLGRVGDRGGGTS